jgi:magnesium transporter
MITYYKTIGDTVKKCKFPESGCWVSCSVPTPEEIEYISNEFKINKELMKSALDEEETSHIDSNGEVTLIVVDSPVTEKSEKNLTYYTMPLSIFLTKNHVITVSLKNNEIIGVAESELVGGSNTANKLNFMLKLFYFITGKYLRYLNQIIRVSDHIERALRKSMKNKELIQLLEIKKSLVYFSYSLKNNRITAERLKRGKFVKFGEDDRELMDDVLIEIKQAIEMSDTYLNIISSTMEVFASIISNNLNIVMKVLASITLIISIPTVVSGIYGMNTPGFPMMDCWWFPLLFSGVCMYISYLVLKRKDMV